MGRKCPNPFPKGNKLSTGGARAGAGRKPDEFKAWLTTTVHSAAARKRFEKIINDEQDAETLVTSEGVEVPVRAKASSYLQALELGLSYDQGKPNQSVDLTHSGGSELSLLPTGTLTSLLELLAQRTGIENKRRARLEAGE